MKRKRNLLIIRRKSLKNILPKILSLILIFSLFFSAFYFLFPTKKVYGATYYWIQTDWSGGSDQINFPSHPKDQKGWQKFASSTKEIIFSEGQISLKITTSSLSHLAENNDFSQGEHKLTDLDAKGNLILDPPYLANLEKEDKDLKNKTKNSQKRENFFQKISQKIKNFFSPILVLKKKTYLQKGDIWEIKFKTKGRGNLEILTEKNTQFGKDLQFEKLICQEKEVKVKILDQKIERENYFCPQISKLKFKVKSAGSHHLLIKFREKEEEISNFACSSGTLDDNCYISEKINLSNGEKISGKGNLIIKNGGILNNNPLEIFFLEIDGSIIIESGGKITGNFNSTSSEFLIKAGGQINLIGKGYVGGSGYHCQNGSGPGGGRACDRHEGGGGASHGGYGGACQWQSPAPTYGSQTEPVTFGSGGGGGGCDWGSGDGGPGGGKLKILAKKRVVVEGEIRVDGQSGGTGERYGGGGGSGGSIWIITSSLSGSGKITAYGGAGGGGFYAGGAGGGGGRIALYLKDDSFSGQISAGNGTIYKKIEYVPKGEYISKIIDFQKKVDFLNLEFEGEYSLPTTTIKIQIATSKDNQNWTEFLGPDGTKNSYYTSSLEAIPSLHDGAQYLKYKVYLETKDITKTPKLKKITFNYQYSAFQGELLSSKYDTSDDKNIVAKIEFLTKKPEGTNLKFQIRTSPDGKNWTPFCGPNDKDNSTSTCDQNSFFEDPSGKEEMDETFKDGKDDRWMQYKVILESEGAFSPILEEVTLVYVINAPPEFNPDYKVKVFQREDNLVKIEYSIRDIDTTQGTVIPNFLMVSFEYSLDSGESWQKIPSQFLVGGEEACKKAVKEKEFILHESFWKAKEQSPNIFSTSTKIRVTLDDKEAANNLASQISDSFVLDTKDPQVGTPPGGGEGININQNLATPLGLEKTNQREVTLYLKAEDDSPLEMIISENPDFSGASFESYTPQKSFTLSEAEGEKTVYLQFKDRYGNKSKVLSDKIILDITSPEIPQNVFLQDVSNAQINEWRIFFVWKKEGVADFYQYQVFRSEDEGKNWQQVKEIFDKNLNYFLDENLTKDQKYCYKVKTLDDILNASQFSASLCQIAGSQPTDPVAPIISQVATSSITSFTAKITWQTNELASSQVLYSPDLNLNLIQGVEGYSKDHEVILRGLAANTTYNFKVRSCDASKNCGESEIFQFTTLAGDNTPPSISQVNVSEITFNSAQIFWQTDEPADSFVEYSLTSPLSEGLLVGKKVAETSHQVLLKNLKSLTTYYFRVRSEDLAGNEAISQEFSFTTLEAPKEGDVTPPQIFNVTTTAIEAHTAKIQWQTNEKASSFVEFGTTLDYGRIYGKDEFSTFHSVELPKDLTPNTTYYFRVRSMDLAGNEAKSENYSFTTKEEAIDTSPPIITFDPSTDISQPKENSVNIRWLTNEEADSFIDYSPESPIFSLSQGSPVFSKDHSLELVNLKPNTQYYFRIRSRDAAGNQAIDDNSGKGYSFFTKKGPTPPVISNIKIINITHNSATILWQTNILATSFVEFGFDLSYGKLRGSLEKTTSHQIVLTDLLPATTYHFRVRSEGSTEAVSEDYSFATKEAPDTTPPKISQIEVLKISQNSAQISWKTDEKSDSLVKYGLTSDYQWLAGTSATSTTFHLVELKDLKAGTTYHFQVLSKDLAGNIATSEDLTFTTQKDLKAPVISQVEVPVISADSATILWQTDEPATSQVEYSTSSNLLPSNFSPEISELKTSHSVILSNLKSDTLYYFRALSKDSFENLATSSIFSFKTSLVATTTERDTQAPIISEVKISVLDYNLAKISWKTNEEANAIVDYGETKKLGQIAGNFDEQKKEHEVFLENLKENTTYYFQVRSQDSFGNTALDNNSGNYYSFTTKAQALKISQVKVALVSYDAALISWQTNKKASSKVEYGKDLNFGETFSDNELTLTHSIKLENLSQNTLYYFKVISKDILGNEVFDDNQGKGYTFKTLVKKEVFIGGGVPLYKKEEKVEKPKIKEKPLEIEEKIREIEEKIKKEIGVENLAQKASKSFIASLFESLSKNISLEKIEEEKFVATVSEMAAKVISPPKISGGYPQVEVGKDYAKFIWLTDKKSNSIVALAEAEKYDPKKPEPYTRIEGNFEELVINHQVLIENLSPATLYHYQVRSKARFGDWTKSEDRTFTTLSLLPEIFNIEFLKITEELVSFKWETNLPTKTKIEIIETKTGEKIIKEDKSYLKEHQLEIKNLLPATNYSLQIIAEDEKGNLSKSSILPFSTIISKIPPVISEVRIMTALIPGKKERVQTIISWKTDKPATSRVFYGEGIKVGREFTLSTPLNEALTLDHVVVTTLFKPGTIYQIRVESKDAFGNTSYSQDFTFSTPSPKESVIDLIVKNFKEIFGFLRKIKF